MELKSCLQKNGCPFAKIFSNNYLLQVIGYEDESIELFFKDSSNLQLSPCGANFRYTRPHSYPVPSLGRGQFEVTQRCVFATSETRQKVVTALVIRNQLCSRPYITSEFLMDMQLDPLDSYNRITSIEWPEESDAVIRNDDGSFTVHSLRGNAAITLCSCKHMAIIEYNVALEDTKTHGESNTDPSRTLTETSTCHLRYVIQNRIFPVSSCPEEWLYPLSLIQKIEPSIELPTTMSDHIRNVPRMAPKKCLSQFMHAWRNITKMTTDSSTAQLQVPEFANSKIRFIWCDGNMYWIWQDGDYPKVEAWVRNKDIFKSHPKNKRYFVHLQAKSQPEKSYSERIIPSSFIPNDTVIKHVMLRCIRMISYRSQQSTCKRMNPCWSSTNMASSTVSKSMIRLQNLKASAKIPLLGEFSAVGDSIEIKFYDGTIVHMCVKVSESTCNDMQKLICGSARIVLKDGKYINLEDLSSAPQCVGIYVNHVKAWVEWLSLPKSDRQELPFCSGTIYDQNQMKIVQKELEKIKKATDINIFQDAGDCALPECVEGSASKRYCNSVTHVTEALTNTGRAIDDIDMMISKFRETIHNSKFC